MDIKSYPEFAPIDKGMKPFFDEAFLKLNPTVSEFTFTNIYSWRQAYNFSVSSLGGFIILRANSASIEEFFQPIGQGNMRSVIEKISKDTGKSFARMPESIAEIFKADNLFKVEFDRDNSDYLYKVEDLGLLKGRKYDAKRNFIKKFKSAYEYEYIKLNETNACECLDFEERWCLVKNCDKVEGLSKERQAIREMLNNFREFNLIGAAIKVKKSICALAIAEKLNSNTIVMHVLKADPNMQGLYQVMLNDFLLNEAKSFTYVNLEQDLGVEGLRISKLSYHPCEIVKKYKVIPE